MPAPPDVHPSSQSAGGRASRWLILLVIPCALLWGSAFPGIRFVYQHWDAAGIEPGLTGRWLFAGLRFTLAGLGLMLFAKAPVAEARRTPWRRLASFALFMVFLQYLVLYLGMSFASGMLGALSVVLGSFWWVILAALFKRSEWPKPSGWAALIAAALGTSIAVFAPGDGGSQPVLGFVILALAQCSGAAALVILPSLKPTIGARAATGWALVGGGLGLALVALPAWPQIPQLFDGPVIAVTCWLAFVSGFAFALWNWLATRLDVSLMATWRFLIPCFGAAESALFLGERPGWGLWIGGGLAVAAMVASVRWVR